MSTPKGTEPVVFKTPTLGHAVRLGELYDQQSGQFLGVQLYAEDTVQTVETDIKNTELSLSLATTLEDKASLLDISAKLSLEVMSGAVSVSGSASYIKDTKSNTNEQAFALALKMRLNEKRILFAEDAMGRNVLRVASEDYIVSGAATHFVSAIVYGGNFIVNLVAKQSKLDTDEKIEGQLQAKFNHMKGAISLEGEVKVKITDELKSLDDKFDIKMHGDIALDRVPVNPKDVLEIIPKGAALIREGGGVPITATLQPIPKKLLDARLVYELDARFVEEVMHQFSGLDDLQSRFAVLVDGIKTVEEFVPELFRTARVVAGKYAEEHGSLLHDLRKFLDDYQHGITPDVWDPVLEKARGLYNRHLDPTSDNDTSTYYKANLVGLEGELLKFQGFVSDIQEARDSSMSLADSCKKFVCLSSLDTISRAIRLQSRIPIFVIPPFTPKHPEPVKLSPDLSLIKFLTILRQNAHYFNNSVNPARILYAETVKGLQDRFPKLVETSGGLKSPSLLIGYVNTKGILSWTQPSPETKLYLDIHHQSDGKSGDLSQSINSLDGRHSFTLQVVAKPSTESVDESVIYILKAKNSLATEDPWLKLQIKPLGFLIRGNRNKSTALVSNTTPAVGQLFVATLVQDVTNKTMTFYLEDRILKNAFITDASELFDESKSVEIAYPVGAIKWWEGEVLQAKALANTVLTTLQVKAEVKKTRNEFSIDGLDGRQSFSLQVVAKIFDDLSQSTDNSVICILRTMDKEHWLTFQTYPFGFVIQQSRGGPIQVVTTEKKPEVGELFVATLVQDVTAKTMTFYLEGDVVKTENFPDPFDPLIQSKHVEIAYPGTDPNITWCDGEALEVKALSNTALDEAAVKDAVDKTREDYTIDDLDGRESFSLQVVAKLSISSTDDSAICILRTTDHERWLTFQTDPFGFVIQQSHGNPIRLVAADKKPQVGKVFVATLVQDVAAKTVVFYLEGENVAAGTIQDASDLLVESKHVEIAHPNTYPNVTWGGGEALEVKALSYTALTAAEVEAAVGKTHERYNG